MPIRVDLDQHKGATRHNEVSDAISLRDCVALDASFQDLATREAGAEGVDPRALAVRTLLHLPRVTRRDRRIPIAGIVGELRATARQLAEDTKAAGHLVSFGPLEAAAPRSRVYDLKLFQFTQIDDGQAADIFSHLHYLRSARPGSRNFALLDPHDERPVSLCSVSPLEWRRVGHAIAGQFGVPMEQAWDVSRVYAVNHAPRNSISYLLSQVRSWLRHHETGVKLLTTAVDTNLSFTGSSYRADNWRHWVTVQPRPYLYHNRRYVSPRQLRTQYGTSNITELAERYPRDRFEQSRVPLLDTMIFCIRVSAETESIPPESRRRLHR